jgi:hypothetical protein
MTVLPMAPSAGDQRKFPHGDQVPVQENRKPGYEKEREQDKGHHLLRPSGLLCGSPENRFSTLIATSHEVPREMVKRSGHVFVKIYFAMINRLMIVWHPAMEVR